MVAHPLNIFSRRLGETDQSEEDLAAEHALVTQRLKNIARSVAPKHAPVEKPDTYGRRSARHPVQIDAQLMTQDHTRIICKIVDLSADGARIEMDATHDLTPLVKLKFLRSGIVRKARIAWQHENVVGLSFQAKRRPAP